MGTFAFGDSYYGLRSFDQTTGVVKDASAVSQTTSSLTSDGVKAKGGAASIVASSAVTASGESIIIERSDKVPWGSGLYGYNRYDLNDLQTIVSVTSTVTIANGNRVRGSDSAVTATSSTTASAETIKLGSIIIPAASGSSVSAVYTIKGSATISVSGSVIIDYVRRRAGSASSTGTSGTLSIGREKWEPIPVTSITWSNVA